MDGFPCIQECEISKPAKPILCDVNNCLASILVCFAGSTQCRIYAWRVLQKSARVKNRKVIGVVRRFSYQTKITHHPLSLMKSITELPENVRVELEQNYEAVWHWMSEQCYERQIAANADALVVRARQRFELSALVSACAGYRVYAGKRGQEASYG